MLSLSTCSVCAMIALLPGTTSVQDIPVHRLAGMTRATHEFSHIAAVRELSDGRIVVSDSREQAVRLLNADLRTNRTIGRSGGGPGEYGSVGAVFGAPADTTILHDPSLRRLLLIHPDGTTGRTLPLPAVKGQVGTSISGRTDGTKIAPTGRYCQQPNTVAPQGTLPDSAIIACGPLKAAEVERVATLRAQERRLMEAAGNVRVFSAVSFGPADGWALADNGDLALVRSAPYRVEWRRAEAAPVLGPAVSWERLPVTSQDRDAVIRRQRAALAGGGPRVRGSDGKIIDAQSIMSNMTPPIADEKPPFDPSGVIAGPGAELWVLRHRRYGEPPRYDVFDGRGVRRYQVELAPSSRVVAVTARGVYVAREDDDGLQHLERWGRPGM